MASKPVEGREAVGGDGFCLGLVGSELTVHLCREFKMLDEEQSSSLSIESGLKMVTVPRTALGAFLDHA